MARTDVESPAWRLPIWWRKQTAAPSETPAPILPPYTALPRTWIKRALAFAALMLFCFVYGFFFSVMAPFNFVFLMAPLMFVAFLVIWVLPDTIRAPVRTLEWLFYAMFISLAVWPNYLAIALPGLPWITMIRLTSFPLVLTLLVCLSVSGEFRRQVTGSFRALSAVPILLAIFVVIQFISIGFSNEVGSSIQRFIVAQTTWTVSFVVAAFLFMRPGQIKRWSIIFWAMAVFVSLLSIVEYRVGHVLWLGHIPSFLKVEDESVQRILGGSMRAGTTRYRTQATFSTPLGLAEFIALALPFAMHFSTARFSQLIRGAAIVSIPVMFYGCYLTDAKLGMVGSLVGILLYGFATAYRNWRANKSNLIAAAFLYAYPAGMCAIFAALMFVGRFKNLILGDGSHANSTDARFTQYTMGFEKILHWPFGYGPGMSGEALGFGRSLSGMITVDTYYLTVALEYGILGFIVYYGMFAIAIFEGGRRIVKQPPHNEDRSFLLPLTVSLAAFVVIKSVFSQQDNHPVIFMMLGAVVALIATYRRTSIAAIPGKKARTRR